jgi:acyl-coenzyme A synthetase/AMP-(fatty) acid ligase
MLLEHLEQDEKLRDHFFSRLEMIFYAAAALPQNLWERMEQLSLAARGKKIPMTAAWGSTETARAVDLGPFPDRASRCDRRAGAGFGLSWYPVAANWKCACAARMSLGVLQGSRLLPGW